MLPHNSQEEAVVLKEGKEAIRTPISVIIPAYNEESGVVLQIEAIKRTLISRGMEYEIVVVDDGSLDKTAERAFRAGARVLRHAENRGYGAALKSGVLAAKNEAIIIIDADGTYPSDQIPDLVAKLEAADMVVGARTGKEVHIPLIRRPAKWLLGWLATRLAGRPIPDLNSGLRAFRRECVKQYFPILSNRFSFTTTLTLALLADEYRVVYHSINYHPRIGQSKIAPRNFMDFVILVIRMTMLFQPLRIFVPLAFSFGLLGFSKATFDIVALFQRTSTFSLSLLYQPVLSTSAILLLLVGLQLLLIGMVADGILRRIVYHNKPLVPSRAIESTESHSNQGVEKPDTLWNVKK